MATNTPLGKDRFMYFLNKVKGIIEKADSSENPALIIYTENMRTPLFMLEALTRLYKKIHNHHKFTKLNILFKDLEDRLGLIDFYDSFHKEFINQKNIPDLITAHLKDKTDESIKDLNHDLKENGWTGKHKKRISKIIKKLDEIDWLNEKEDTAGILDVYQYYIDKITEKYSIKNLEFKDIETDVHELRRELRWLSIYPQALRGLMQLKTDNETEDFLQKYLTPEIVNSPYNIMPDGSSLQKHIMLNKNYFYALSWMIAELGKLKDSGLKIETIKESLVETNKKTTEVEQLANSINDENKMKIPEILNQSQKITTTFFEEKILEKIIC